MNSIKMKVCAKVNLGLDILDKRVDGYHNIETVMHSINMCDTIVFKKSDSIKIKCNNPVVPTGDTNIVYRCIEQISKYTNNPDKLLDVEIEKKIPVSAGLGGGSCNGAAALIAYNIIYDLGLSKKELCKIGVKIGADIPFLVYGGAAFCSGIGEVIRNIYPLIDCYMVLCKPEFGVSTKEAYDMVDSSGVKEKPNFNKLIHGILNNDKEDLEEGLINVFEPYVCEKYPQIISIKESLSKFKPIGVQMSGSGPSVFALYDNIENANNAFAHLKNIHKDVFVTNFMREEESIEILEIT